MHVAELVPRDVDTVDGPTRWYEGQVHPVADPDLERTGIGTSGHAGQDVAEDLHASPAHAALER